MVFPMRKTSGQSLVEYALILALVSVVCAGTLTNLGTGVNTTIGNVNQALEVSGVGGAGGGPNGRGLGFVTLLQSPHVLSVSSGWSGSSSSFPSI